MHDYYNTSPYLSCEEKKISKTPYVSFTKTCRTNKCDISRTASKYQIFILATLYWSVHISAVPLYEVISNSTDFLNGDILYLSPASGRETKNSEIEANVLKSPEITQQSAVHSTAYSNQNDNGYKSEDGNHRDDSIIPVKPIKNQQNNYEGHVAGYKSKNKNQNSNFHQGNTIKHILINTNQNNKGYDDNQQGSYNNPVYVTGNQNYKINQQDAIKYPYKPVQQHPVRYIINNNKNGNYGNTGYTYSIEDKNDSYKPQRYIWKQYDYIKDDGSSQSNGKFDASHFLEALGYSGDKSVQISYRNLNLNDNNENNYQYESNGQNHIYIRPKTNSEDYYWEQKNNYDDNDGQVYYWSE